MQMFRQPLSARMDASGLNVPGYVYFVQGETKWRRDSPSPKDGLIKIGWATKPEARLDALRRASPVWLQILATIPGTKLLEREFHFRFDAHRQHFEWFSPVPELIGFIEDILHRRPDLMVGASFNANAKRARRPDWEKDDNHPVRIDLMRRAAKALE